MADPIRDQLYRAYELVKAGKRSEAQAILVPILQDDEENGDAWWLLANALTDPNDIREALETVLRLKPGYAAAEKKLAALNAKYPPPQDDDPFADMLIETSSTTTSGTTSRPRQTEQLDDSFDVLDRKPLPKAETRARSSKGTNPLVIVLAVVGGLALCVCLACVGFTLLAPSILGASMEGVVQTLEAGGDFGELNFSTGNVRQVFQNNISYGEAWRANLDLNEEHTYNFSGSAGETVVITMVATNAADDLDPYITLYDANGAELAFDDDSAGNWDAELVYQLPSNGAYTIGAGSWSATSAGDYEIRLMRR